MHVRAERPDDRKSIYDINAAAFGREDEAKLVDALREHALPFLSMVAENDGVILGHIVFTPVLVTEHTDLKMMGLGPVAVTPKRQRSGIGSLLVRTGLEACKSLGFGAVVVLGHPEYYPRFGFIPASRFGLDSEFDAPDEAFMALELDSGYLEDRSGTVIYHGAFRNENRNRNSEA